MFKNAEEVRNFCKEEKVEFIDFKLIDLAGRWHHLTITPERLTNEKIKNGIGFDGSSYGFLTVEKSDMIFRPDFSTSFIDPFVECKTLAMLTKIYYSNDQRFESDPRHIAEKAEKYIYDTGITDQILLGPEFEFYILDKVAIETSPHRFGVEIDSDNAEWNSGNRECNLAYKVQNRKGYHVDLPKDVNFNLRNQMVLLLENNKIPVKYHHAEVGGPGQMEIEVSFDSLLKMSDHSMKIKYLVKNEAIKENKTVTFMPKPIFGEAGNGMHVHINLYKEGQPIFYDKEGYSGLSSLALNAIGGILKHAPAIMAFSNPSTNSFKRLIPGYEAPVSICFGTSNRSAVIRVPGYANAPLEKRFEFRTSDATCNPYLCYSALLLAAIDGIERNIDPSEEGFGPYDINIYKLSDTERDKIKSLPKDLLEVVEALRSDNEFLMKGDAFSMNIINDQINSLIEQHNEINTYPTAKEFEKYFDL